MLNKEVRKLLGIPNQALLPDTLPALYDGWFAGRGYETRFGEGWKFASRASVSKSGMPHHLAALTEGYVVCLEHQAAQSWFAMDEAFRVYVECEEWVQIASSFLRLVEVDALLVESNAKGDRRNGLGTFPTFEEFEKSLQGYLSTFQEVTRDFEFTRVYRGAKSVIVASRFHSDEYAICGIEYF